MIPSPTNPMDPTVSPGFAVVSHLKIDEARIPSRFDRRGITLLTLGSLSCHE